MEFLKYSQIKGLNRGEIRYQFQYRDKIAYGRYRHWYYFVGNLPEFSVIYTDRFSLRLRMHSGDTRRVTLLYQVTSQLLQVK